MTASSSEDDAAQPQADDHLVTVDDFGQVDWQEPLGGARKVDASDLATLYLGAAKAAEANEDSRGQRVFLLLFHVCNIVLDPRDRATQLRTRLILENGRSAEPADYRGPQSAVFATLMATVANPGLRARLADIVWTNDRKESAAAAMAVDAYCEAVEGLLAGDYDEAVPGFGRSTFEQVTLAHRALQVGRATLKGNSLPPRACEAARAVYDLARSTGEHVVFTQAAHVLGTYGLVEPADIGRDAEAVADGEYKPGHAMAVQGVWDFAAEAYAAAKDPEGERRCRLRSVDMTLDRARSVQSSLVASHLIRAAIEALRLTQGTQQQRAELLVELRERQLAARDEMRPSRRRIDVTDLAEATVQAFGDDDLPGLLRAFVELKRMSDPEVVRSQALEMLTGSPLSGLFGGSHHEGDGKVVAETPAFDLGGAPPEARIDEMIDQIMGNERLIVVGGCLTPAREHIVSWFTVGERHFWPIVELSPFVPPDQAALFALGFARFFQGDFMSAAHLLLPQIEPALRHVLICLGHEPTIIKANMLQEDQTLSPLLTNWRDQLEGYFGPDIVFEIDVLFNKRPGPRLRHEFAHGKITAGQCFAPDVVYACWLLLHITVFPLLEYWDDVIAPAMGRVEGDPGVLRR
jgi:hypothetical protein